MQTIIPSSGPGVALGVGHLLGFVLDFLDLTDPADAPLPLVELPGGAIILGVWADVVTAFDDGAASAITLEPTFALTADAFASIPASTLSALAGGAASLIPATAPAPARVLDAPAILAVGTTSAAATPYTAGSVVLWVLVAETNG